MPAPRSPLFRLATAALVSAAVITCAPSPVEARVAAPTSAASASADATLDWTGEWIGRDNPDAWPDNGQQNPAPLLRKSFEVDKKVTAATLSVVGLGFYEAWINGHRVGRQVLDPAPTVYDKTAYSRTFDVTDSLRRGANVIGAELGRGYFGVPGIEGDSFNYDDARWRSEPRLLAQLDVRFADGTTQRIITDGTWKIADSGTRDNYYLGETQDARQESRAWRSVHFDDTAWSAASVQTAPTQHIVPATQPPMEVTGTLRSVHVTKLADGSRVYDFGRHLAGWARISGHATAGTSVRMVYGEQLNEDGSVHQYQADQDAGARHVDGYTFAGGKGREAWEPSFTRHGFRYVQVTASAPVDGLRIEARLVHNAVRATGAFTSASPLLNQIHANQRRSLLDNMANLPTDTPWRDRQGWTADAYLFLDSAALNFDVEDFYTDWLRTFRDSQQPDGSLPIIAPDPGSIPVFNDPSWSGTLVLDVWDLYQHYGDTGVLTDNYATMAKWMDLMDTTVAATGDIYTGFSFGDWASPGAEAAGQALFAPEASDLTATADLYQEARTLARIARSLGHDEDATRYGALADRIKAAFNDRFFDEDTNTYGTTGNPFVGGGDPGYRQTSNVIPLAYGLVPEEKAEAVLAQLVKDIKSHGDDLGTGSIGTKQLLPVLTRMGRGQLAYRLATQTDYPSWGNWVRNGATTSWETWSITSPGQSMNHAFLGTVDDWFFQDLAGIKPAAPGYARVRIDPLFPRGLAHASASITTPRGPVSVRWHRTTNGVKLTVHVPRGVQTDLRLPATADAGETGHGRTLSLGGGVHTFRVS